MPKSKKTIESNHKKKRGSLLLVAYLLVISVAVGVLLYPSSKTGNKPANSLSLEEEAPAAAATFTPKGEPTEYIPKADGTLELADLDLVVIVSPQLAAAGLIGTPGADPKYPDSKGISFSSPSLSQLDSGCKNNDTAGWLGTLTRYEGSSAAMTDHELHHTTAILDFPGFHTSYRSVTQLCPERAPGFTFTVADLTQERDVAGQLWQSIRGAEYLKP